MTEDKKQGWWRSIPGLLTATTGLVAALSGLVAGLNQTGVFDRLRAVQSAPETLAAVRPESLAAPRTIPAETSAPEHTSTPAQRSAPTTQARPTAEPPQPPPVSPSATSRSAVLPSGTVLELTSREKICSADSKVGGRFTASLVAAVKAKGGGGLPAGTQAVLTIQHPPAPGFLGARLDSLVTGAIAIPIRKSDVRLRREIVRGKGGSPVGACLPQGGKIRVTLRAPARLPEA